MLPRHLSKFNQDVAELERSMAAAIKAAKEVQEKEGKNDELLKTDKSYQAFVSNLDFRILVAKAWSDGEVDEAGNGVGEARNASAGV